MAGVVRRQRFVEKVTSTDQFLSGISVGGSYAVNNGFNKSQVQTKILFYEDVVSSPFNDNLKWLKKFVVKPIGLIHDREFQQ